MNFENEYEHTIINKQQGVVKYEVRIDQ